MKNKSIIISGDVHEKLKIFCRGKNMKIGAVVEDLIKLFLEKPKEIQNKVDEIKNIK